MIGWALHFAGAMDQPLVVLCPSADEKEVREFEVIGELPQSLAPLAGIAITAAQRAIRQRLGETDAGEAGECPPVTVRSLPEGDDVTAGLLGQLEEVRLLVAAHHEKASANDLEASLEMQLYRRAPCDTLLLRPGSSDGNV